MYHAITGTALLSSLSMQNDFTRHTNKLRPSQSIRTTQLCTFCVFPRWRATTKHDPVGSVGLSCKQAPPPASLAIHGLSPVYGEYDHPSTATAY
eukprot:2573418-Pleurochrysis_carterae.AAC.1